MQDTPAGPLDGARHQVAAVGDRRGAGDQDEIELGCQLFGDGTGDGVRFMGAAGLGGQAARQVLHPGPQDLHRLVQHLGAGARKEGLHQAHGAGPVGRNPHHRAPCDRGGPFQERAGDEKGDDLYGRHHRSGLDGLPWRQGGDRDRLVDQVQGIQLVCVVVDQPAARRQQVDPSRERGFGADSVAGHGPADGGGRPILVHVARFRPGDGDFGQLRRVEGGQIVVVEPAALFQRNAPKPEGVGEDAAPGFGQRYGAELHDPCPPRMDETISAMIETAISAGETAPISHPMGPRMRSRDADSAPLSINLSQRAA